MRKIRTKFAVYVLPVIMALALYACSDSDDTQTPGPEPTDENVPKAIDDNVATVKNMALKLDSLISNDTVFEYARITTVDATTAQEGTITDNRDGSYTYMPPEDFTGEDSFEYTICDNKTPQNCSTAQVTVNVMEAVPEAQDDSYEVKENNELIIRSFLKNDEFVSDATMVTLDSSAVKGSVALQDDGTILYTATNGFAGEDSFTYTLCNGNAPESCSTATITLIVNDEGNPVAQDDLVASDKINTTINITNLLDNDDLTDDAVITSIDATASTGTVVLNEDGTVSYTPTTAFVGTDTFTYSLCDDDTPEPSCAEATVTVEIVNGLGFSIPTDLQDYYSDVAFSDDMELNYTIVSDLTTSKHMTFLTYGQRHDYLYDADADPSNPANVIMFYSGDSRDAREYISGNNNYETQTFNTEHLFPQSKLDTDIEKADLNILRPADDAVNSERSNYPYTDGSGTYKLVDGNRWFPGDDWKGDVARAVLYMNVRYGKDYNKIGTLDLFLKWNREDPVSAIEKQRNNVVEDAQGNRNPFIDNPYLITIIYGGEPAENTWE